MCFSSQITAGTPSCRKYANASAGCSNNPGSWLAYFGSEIVFKGAENGGIEKKYRPRGYDEGPKKD